VRHFKTDQYPRSPTRLPACKRHVGTLPLRLQSARGPVTGRRVPPSSLFAVG
jgi:hypothetical protein